MIRAAVIGWGNAGKYFHIPFIRAVEGLELAGVVTTQSQAKASLPDVPIFSSVDALLDEPDIDLVVVASPHRLHASHARMALEAGKDVVIEKPVAGNTSEAEELYALADQVQRRLIVFQNRRYDGNFLTLKQIIASGILGEPYYFESHWALYRPFLRNVWREKPEEMGGALFDLGPHMIDQALQLFGKPNSVYAQLYSHRPDNSVDDYFRIHMHYGSGLDVVLGMDFKAPLPLPRFHLRGTQGSYEQYGHDPQEATLRNGEQPGGENWGLEDPPITGKIFIQQPSGIHVEGSVDVLAGDYRQFYADVRDRNPALEDRDKIILQMRIIEAVQRSAENNTLERID